MTLPTPSHTKFSQVPALTAIINNPHGNKNSLYNFFTETFSENSYRPNLTEGSVKPSRLLPPLDNNLFSQYRKLTPVIPYNALDH